MNDQEPTSWFEWLEQRDGEGSSVNSESHLDNPRGHGTLDA